MQDVQIDLLLHDLSLQDGNIPSGESFVRQFLIGQKFFKEEFGSYCSVVSAYISKIFILRIQEYRQKIPY